MVKWASRECGSGNSEGEAASLADEKSLASRLERMRSELGLTNGH